MATKLFDKGPVCGGDLEKKGVEKILKGGSNTAIHREERDVVDSRD